MLLSRIWRPVATVVLASLFLVSATAGAQTVAPRAQVQRLRTTPPAVTQPVSQPPPSSSSGSTTPPPTDPAAGAAGSTPPPAFHADAKSIGSVIGDAAGPYQAVWINGSLPSATDSQFLRFTLRDDNGTCTMPWASCGSLSAVISLTNIPAGSDFDLYAYRSDGTPIGLSNLGGNQSESVLVRTQDKVWDDTADIVIELRPHAWSATEATYTLKITGSTNP